jgi:pseudouridine kinase
MDVNSLVLVIGAAGIDIKGIPHTAPVWKASTPGIVRRSFGGVARNIAENLARLEVNVALLTVIGGDVLGEAVLKHCQQSGINMNYIKRDASSNTGSYVSVMDEEGDLAIAVSDYEIMQTLDSDYLESQRELFAKAEMIALDLNVTEEALAKILDLADDYDVPVVADPTTPTRAGKLRPYLDHLYVVTPNAAETTSLCDLEFPAHDHATAVEAARHLIKLGTKIAIVTLGDQGLAYADANSKGHIPSTKTHIVDSTGAGDALTAGVMFGLVNDLPLDEAMRLGVTAAVITLRSLETVCPELTPDLLYDGRQSSIRSAKAGSTTKTLSNYFSSAQRSLWLSYLASASATNR